MNPSADAEGFAQTILGDLHVASGRLTVGEVRQRVAQKCAASGKRMPTQARLWRHLVRLERKGIVRREVRMGGTGGTATRVILADRP